MDIKHIIEYLKQYDGEPVNIMEVCGTHTSCVTKSGLKSILSPKIKLISGPGCPVCVTTTQYVDKLCEISKREGYCIVSFGDMLRVSGSCGNLIDAKADGGKVEMIYSPFDIIKLAQDNPSTTFVFAAVGFETTTPIYALILKEIIEKDIKNIKFLTSLKTMPNAIDYICVNNSEIEGFIAPGNVSVITGFDIYKPLAQKYNKPFVVAGFDAQQIICAIYMLIKNKQTSNVINLYKSAVTEQGNINANAMVDKYFYADSASWRGIGSIQNSGLYIKEEYKNFDYGSYGLDENKISNKKCICGKILTGKAVPTDCTLFGTKCTPENPVGACMASSEGCCYNYGKG